jgi:hypothetical protein
VLDLFIPVVDEDIFQFFILADIDSLVVPVDRFQFLHQ